MTDFTREQLAEVARWSGMEPCPSLAAFAIALLDRVDEWEKVFGHIDKDPDTAGNKIIEARREIEAERDRLRAELREAEEAILHADKWWQETYHDQQDELDLITGNKIEPCGDGCEACAFEMHPAVRRARERAK